MPEIELECPLCAGGLRHRGWQIVGLRAMVLSTCSKCSHDFAVDLPTGHTVHVPLSIDLGDGKVFEPSAPSTADILTSAFRGRYAKEVGFEVSRHYKVTRPLVLNTLDYLYGHSLLKLLNAQFFLEHCEAFDLIVITPTWLRWMIPPGVAEIWQVDIPANEGRDWNSWLSERIAQEASRFPDLWLASALAHPHPADFAIQEFTRVAPFDCDRWKEAPKEPKVSFVWRDDRTWEPSYPMQGARRRIARFRSNRRQRAMEVQRRCVIELASLLRASFPKLKFSVAGIGTRMEFPTWIDNLVGWPKSDQDERRLCEEYSDSHVVVGVHGSNMLLPSAHAGAAVELVPLDRWGNLFQDLLPSMEDSRTVGFMYRNIPAAVSPSTCAAVVEALIIGHEVMDLYLSENQTRRSLLMGHHS